MDAHVLLFALALLGSLCLTPLVRSFARWTGMLDRPDGRRKLHAAPVPKLGGVAIFIAFYACLWGVSAGVDSPAVAAATQLASATFVPSLLILVLGIVDDRRPLSPWIKIGVQLAAGLLVYYYLDIRVERMTTPFSDSSMLGALSLPVTLFWIVLITNAFNVVDGMDGLAAGVALVALSTMFFVSLQTVHPEIALVAAPLAGAVAGFLRYNYNPASIFLGDSGSLFLGFQLAVLSIAGSQKSSTAVAVAAPLFILALPLIETATSMIRRFVTGRSILKADAGHIHHQLIRLGFTPRRAAGILYLASGAFGLASLLILQNNGVVIGLIVLSLAVVTWFGIQQLGYTEFAEINSAFSRFLHQRRIIQNSIVSRKLARDLVSASSLGDAWRMLSQTARQLGFASVELRVAPEHAGDAAERRSYAQRLTPMLHGAAGDETRFAIALASGSGHLGEVVFSRSTDAAPLHSELPLLIGAVAQGLPRILENSRSRASATVAPPDAPCPKRTVRSPGAHERAMALPRLEPAARRHSCPSCATPGLHRSRSRSLRERVRKTLTEQRLHECEVCSWRGWMSPFPRVSDESAAVIVAAPPDLQALDLAIVGIGDSASTKASRTPAARTHATHRMRSVAAARL